MAPGAASAVGAGARWLSGKQQPHALGGAEGSGGLTAASQGRAETPSTTSSHPTASPSHPHPHALRHQGRAPSCRGRGGGRAVPAPLLCPPHPPPKVPCTTQTPLQASKPCSSLRVSYATSGQAELPQSHRNPKTSLLGWRNEGRNAGGALTRWGLWPGHCASPGEPLSGGSAAGRNSRPVIPA